MYRVRVCMVFVICVMMLVPHAALADTYTVTGRDRADVTFKSEAEATNVPPAIDTASFVFSITAEAEVYPGGARATAAIPFAFTGEDIVFTIEVTDDNGEEDIEDGVMIVLSEDESVDADDISIPLNAVESTKDGDVRLTFTKTWNVPADAYGEKNILVTAADSGGLSADNSGTKTGVVFVNPQIGFEITTDTGEDVGSIPFAEGAPGTTDVSAQDSLRIKSLDPDGVGMNVTVLVQGEDLENQNAAGSIPIAKMKVDGTPMSTALQTIDECLAPDESSTHSFSLDYPLPLPAGNYVGTVTFEIVAL